MLVLYSVQTTNSSMASKKMRCTIDGYGIVEFQIVSHTKYRILCSDDCGLGNRRERG